MAKGKRIPHFRSRDEERAFWETHDAFEVLGEEGWEVAEAGMTPVRSFYIVRVDRYGALVRIPKTLLEQLGAQEGQKLRVWTEDHRLVLEAPPK
jgi:hypothetical protein